MPLLLIAATLAGSVLGVTSSDRPLPALRGTVMDPDGAVVREAEVVLWQAGSPVVRTTTDATGRFAITVEAAGEYVVRVRAEGFQEYRSGAIYLGAEPIVLDVRLRVATLLEVVRVSVEAPVGVEVEAAPLEIEKTGSRTALDAVEQLVPSVYVGRRGILGYGIGSQAGGMVSIRGIGERPNTAVLIMIDGRPDFQGIFSHPLPDLYNLDDVENIEVIRRPASALYGSNAMGGVINIRPFKPRQEGLLTRLTTSWGSFGTSQNSLRHGGKKGNLEYAFTAGTNFTSGHRPSSFFRSQDTSLRVDYQFNPGYNLGVQGNFGYFKVFDPGTVTHPLENNFAKVGRGGGGIHFRHQHERLSGSIRFLSHHGHHIISDGFHSIDSTQMFDWKETLSLRSNFQLGLGTSIVRYGGEAGNSTLGLDFGGHHINEQAVFGWTEYRPSARIRLHGAARLHRNSQYGTIFVPDVGFSLLVDQNTNISFDISKGFRNPTIRELYLFATANPTLQPEHVWNYQATLTRSFGTRFYVSTTGYYAHQSNLIVVTGMFPNLILENTGKVLNRGIELSSHLRASPHLGFQFGYALVHSTKLLPSVPVHKLNFGISSPWRRLNIHFNGQYIDGLRAALSSTTRLPDYFLGTLKLTLPIRSNIDLFAIVDNVFNQDYQVLSGYPMPGTTAYGGLSIRWGNH